MLAGFGFDIDTLQNCNISMEKCSFFNTWSLLRTIVIIFLYKTNELLRRGFSRCQITFISTWSAVKSYKQRYRKLRNKSKIYCNRRYTTLAFITGAVVLYNYSNNQTYALANYVDIGSDWRELHSSQAHLWLSALPMSIFVRESVLSSIETT